MYKIQDVCEKVRSYLPNVDITPILKAYEYADRAHQGQLRLSGLPYIQHPLAVADLVATLKLDVPSICAALLHDVREDQPERSADLEEQFGKEISEIVDGLTKLKMYQFTSKQEKQAENFKKMLVAMSKDIRVLLVKLCDRLNNMRELQFMTEEKQKEIAEETLRIYAPLAERLGISWVRSELEDLSFQFLWREDFEELKRRVEERLKERKGYIREVINAITKILEDAGLSGFEVTGRQKHLFGIYRKMKTQGIELEQVYDLVAFRVIVQSIPDCWQVLGHIHSRWTPIPARFKDFINVPKPNGYRSLHTSVFGPLGEPMEVQIRTWEMHKVAESGIAAHWTYKEGGSVAQKIQEKFNWLRQLIDFAHEVQNPNQFLSTIKVALFVDEIFVFTPKGELRVLPKGATPVDFAYEIHTEVGHRCVGAKVNGRLVPLSTKLHSGDRVEIITSKQGRPKRDWLSFVATARAQNKIRAFFLAEERAHATEIGKELLEKEFKRCDLNFKKILEDKQAFQAILEKTRSSSVDELLLKVGTSKIKPFEVLKIVKPDAEESQPPPEPKKEPKSLLDFFTRRPKGIGVDGVEDTLLHLAKCCNPIPGDKIIGFVTRGRGVTIHAEWCKSLQAVEPERLIEAYWLKNIEGVFGVPVSVRCVDEPGVLAKVTKAIADKKVNIASISTKNLGDRVTEVRMVLEVEGQEQLDAVMRLLSKTKGVIGVTRIRQSGSI